MKRVTLLLVLVPALAAAQGRSVPICGRTVDARATGDDTGRTVFGAALTGTSQAPGVAVARGEDFVVFGADPSVDHCPCGAEDVRATATPSRFVYRWQVALASGGPTLVREDCLETAPTDAAPGTTVETIGTCLRCRWVRHGP